MQAAQQDALMRPEATSAERENESDEGGQAPAEGAAPAFDLPIAYDQASAQVGQALTDTNKDTNTASNGDDTMQRRLTSNAPVHNLVADPTLGIDSHLTSSVAPETDSAAEKDDTDKGDRVDGDAPAVATNGDDSPHDDNYDDDEEDKHQAHAFAHAMPSSINSVLAELSSDGLTLAAPWR